MCAKTARVDVAARAGVRQVPGVGIRVLPAVACRVAQAHVAMKPVLRVVRHADRTAAGATINRQLRTATIGLRVGPVAAIAVVRAVPIQASRVRIRHVRTMQVRRVLLASHMDKGVRRVRVVLLLTSEIPRNSAVGTCPRVSTPGHARDDRAATRMHRGRTRDVPAPAVRVVPAGMVRRAAPARMRVRTNNAHSHHARPAIARVAIVPKVIVRQAACRAARTPAPPAKARKAIAPEAIVRAAIIRADNNVAPEGLRRTRVRMARVRIDPTPRVVRVTKGCRATRIESARASPGSIGYRGIEVDSKERTACSRPLQGRGVSES
jgi:hypothetical protein